MAYFASAGDVKGSRTQEGHVRRAVTGEVGRVPAVVFHDDLVSTVQVQINPLQEFRGISGAHSVVSHVVRRQWAAISFFDVLKEF